MFERIRRGVVFALLVLGFELAVDGRADRPGAGHRVSDDGSLTIEHVGPVPLPLLVPGATVFTAPGDLIRGRLQAAPYEAGVVQIISRTVDGGWVATGSAVDVLRRSQKDVRWTLAADSVGCDEARPPIEVAVVFVRHRLPVGRIDPIHSWNHAVRSQSLTLSCARLEQASIDVVAVGHTPVSSNNPPRVSHYEDVRVSVARVPPGAILQLCLQPIENPNVWCQDGAHTVVDANWLGTAYIGRPAIRRGPGGLEFVDQYSRFWLRAFIVRAPLPVRQADGIAPNEWLGLRPLVLKESRPVEVIRAYRPGQARVVLVHLGDTTDGRMRLADTISRVDGQFRPLPGYVRTSREVISVLVRRVADKEWSVSGAATLSGDLTHWLITAADLNPQADAGGGERIAIAVLTRRLFPPQARVTEAMLRQHALSVSDEVRFRLFRPSGDRR